jgi:putative endonuclease
VSVCNKLSLADSLATAKNNASEMSCFCYIVECADGTFYTGWAIDPQKRVAVHNKGRGARYTRTRIPVKLVYVEELPDRKSAMKRELAIKKMKRGMKMRLIGKSRQVDRF